MKAVVIVILLTILYSGQVMSEVSLLIEGPDRDIYYGETVELKLTIWPIENKEKYQNIFDKDVFDGAVKVLTVIEAEISEHNNEALVIRFIGAILNSELPEKIELDDMSVVLMKRTLSILEFHPETEEIIIFNQNINTKEMTRVVVYFVIFCVLFILLLFAQKLLRSRRFQTSQRRKYLDVCSSLKKMDVLELANFLYRNEDIWLKYYDKGKWKTVKSELNKYVYKKSLDTQETLIVEKQLNHIIEEIDRWSI